MGRGGRAALVGIAVVLVAVVLVTPAGAATASSRTAVRTPGPMRVLLVGDSITLDYQDEAAQMLVARGYQVTRAGFWGRSLLDANMCKAGEAKNWLKIVDPDVVVFQAIGNYALLADGGIPPCVPTVVPGSKPFFRKWKAAAKANQRVLTRRRARFLWILNPATSPPRHVEELNSIYRQVAGTKAGTVDAWGSFGGPTYNPSLHQWDGLHLNPAGSQRLADLVVAAVG